MDKKFMSVCFKVW